MVRNAKSVGQFAANDRSGKLRRDVSGEPNERGAGYLISDIPPHMNTVGAIPTVG
jgi:hypothetical protein